MKIILQVAAGVILAGIVLAVGFGGVAVYYDSIETAEEREEREFCEDALEIITDGDAAPSLIQWERANC